MLVARWMVAFACGGSSSAPQGNRMIFDLAAEVEAVNQALFGISGGKATMTTRMNYREELRAEIERLREEKAKLVRAIETLQLAFEGPACCEAKSAMGEDAMPGLLIAFEKARAALAKAKP